jgi:hypothetical protein
MSTWIRGAAAAAILAATPLYAQSLEGTWTSSALEGERLQLTLHYERSSTWGRSVSLADLSGLDAHQVAALDSRPVSFALARESGRFDFQGVFQEGRGAGHFRFTPDRRFVATLRALGVSGADAASDRQLMQMALADVSASWVREIRQLGFALDLDAVRNGAIHRVSPDFVRGLRAEGVELRGMDDAVSLRIHRVTAEYVRELRAIGLGELSRNQLTEMRIHRVTPEFVREMRSLGFADLSHRHLVEMRIHRVTPEFVRELEELGYRGLTRRQLVQMRIHRVTPEFIRQVRAGGFGHLPPETLVRMRIHRIEVPGSRAEPRARP